MGNQYSAQFQRALRDGDTKKATELYSTKKKQLMEGVQPNESLGADHHHNSYLHYAALYGLEGMYSDLLKLKGKPDMKNSERRNCIHLICMGRNGAQRQTKYRMLCLTMTEGLQGMDLKHLLTEKDQDGNTALHLAAEAGLEQCVDLLVKYEANMVATNEKGLTPADLAKENHQANIATTLEAKMVFSCAEDLAEAVEPDSELLEEIAEEPKGMHDTDLRSMKDALLIETSEMLGVGLQSAEVLLKHYGWSKEALLGAWLESAERVCAESGVDMPEGGGQDVFSAEGSTAQRPTGQDVGSECGICCTKIDHRVIVPCDHHFCGDCWKEYLEQKISTGDSQNISCPEYGCYKLVPLEVIEGVVSQEMASKFLSFDLKAFVDSNPNIRWCPHPGCSQAVTRPQPLEDASPTHPTGEVKGQSVPCGSGHYFCWECLGECHEPSTCKQWQCWLDHCKDMKAKIGETTAAEVNEAASSKWLVDNSKPCPKCRSPIEKTEGCNHMCCKHCRYDFCWVCLDDWKCHNSSTGGYFNCNRYDAQARAGHYLNERRQGALKNCKDWEAMSKFLHYYERYKEHINSYKLEEPFLDKAQEKMIELAHSIQHLESRGLEGPESWSRHGSVSVGKGRRLDLTFIQDAVQELLKCRRVLKASYCYGYYLTGIISKKQFEHMQGALEQVTEILAEAVARPHLRKPRLEIIRLTREAREKRVGLVKNVHSGLPMATYPFVDSFGGSGLPLAPKHRFLRDLDTYKPAVPRHGRSHRQDTDEDLLRVLEMSRLEYEADKKMQADMELAKSLSLTLPLPNSPSPEATPPTPPPVSQDLSTSGNWWESLSPRRRSHTTPTHGWLDSWIHSHSSSVDEPSWPVLREATPPHHEAMTTETTGHVGTESPRSPPWDHAPQSPPWVHAAEWGPVYGEEEDLDKAIKDSLAHTPNHTPMAGLAARSNLSDIPERDYTTTRKDMLVIDYHAPQPSPHPQDQLVRPHPWGDEAMGYNLYPQEQVTGFSPSQEEYRPEPSGRTSYSQSGPGRYEDTPLPSGRDPSLPSPLQQLLDSNVRIGTNV